MVEQQLFIVHEREQLPPSSHRNRIEKSISKSALVLVSYGVMVTQLILVQLL
mgnify:CR=1 FL=1